MFGMSDGIHLKYAGMEYFALDKKKFRSYFRFTCIHSFSMFVLFSSLILVFIDDSNRAFALVFIGLNIFLFNINGFFIHVNQVTSRFKFYSWGIVLDRIIFVISIIPLLFLTFDSYKYYIVLNVISRVVVFLYHVYTARDMVIGETYPIKEYYSDIIKLMAIGLPLTVSSILSMFLISFPRLLIDKFYGIEIFAAFSFANSMLSMAIQIVIAVSTVLYPLLKKVEIENYKKINDALNSSVWIFGSLMLGMYFPIVYLLKTYMPKYESILDYLFVLFPMMIYQCKNNVILTTFYKALRLEKKLLLFNFVGLIVNFSITIIFYSIFNSIFSIVITSVICFAVWTYVAECYLNSKYNWGNPPFYIDFLIIVSFLYAIQLSNWIIGLIVYFTLLLFISIIFNKTIKEWYSMFIFLKKHNS